LPQLPHVTLFTATGSKLHSANSLATVLSKPALVQTPNSPRSKPHLHFPLLRSFQWICVTFRNKQSFYAEELLAPRPTPKLEDHHSLTAVRDCLFNINADGVSCIRDPMTPLAVVTRTSITWRFHPHT